MPRPAWAGALDQRAGAMGGEGFQQQGMGRAAVEDDGGLDAAVDRIEAGFHLGDHAAVDRAVGDQGAGLFRRHAVDQLAVLVEDARHVGQQQEARGPHRRGDGARRGIGIDIIGVAVLADADGRDDGDEVRPLEQIEHAGIDDSGSPTKP